MPAIISTSRLDRRSNQVKSKKVKGKSGKEGMQVSDAYARRFSYTYVEGVRVPNFLLFTFYFLLRRRRAAEGGRSDHCAGQRRDHHAQRLAVEPGDGPASAESRRGRQLRPAASKARCDDRSALDRAGSAARADRRDYG